ncbi:conserved hypothetical protein [Ricinus communis]|uniref:Uncharacterized protein n=1 Tax=Ricinus communis TaxID=3988 RepID=B9S223_RICCO|nr:conserved hypothetical protein [Ricinus communis]
MEAEADVPEQIYDFIMWVDRELNHYEKDYVNGIRREMTDLRNERNEVLVLAREANVKAECRLAHMKAYKEQNKALLEVNNILKGENQELKEESGLLFMEIDLFKEKLECRERKYDELRK